MSTGIPYKALQKTLKMMFTSEITEKKGQDYKNLIRLTYVDIIPEKSSFWSGEQGVKVIRETAPVHHLPENRADAFVQQVSNALYHLNFKIGHKGMPVSLEKQDELWKRWLMLRELLADSFTGDWVDEMLTKVDLKMLPSPDLFPQVMEDLFLNEYFRNIYELKFDSGINQLQRNLYGLLPEVVKLQERWSMKSSANHYQLRFASKWTGNELGEKLNHWIKIKTGSDAEGKPEITGSGSFLVSKETGWCSSLESTYALTTGSGYEKIMKINLKSI
ncbi:hypothetical protein HDF26_004227 [Pedobacter cryoconitis]|uniref:hypothetical protein n=1 Tax=Pedobacter cryoconitis TaxID=188932 RepID=UPI001613C3FA|nr:hypothetical protein [Pedobacter cryoconitis]MBB6273767.1 hypothetical protein [Pedobacter cryoconitis]